MGRYLALVPMALALAACGGGGGGALSLDPVASAATKTEKSGGEHMTFRVHVKLPGNGGSFVVNGSGDFDSAKNRGRAMGIDLNSLMQSSTGDPTQMLRYLESASTGVQKIGAETVTGAATTHYSSVVDLDKLAQARPHEKSSIRRLEQLTGVHDIPVDVWVDGDGYVRKLKESLTTPAPQMKMVISLQLSAFGKHVTISPP